MSGPARGRDAELAACAPRAEVRWRKPLEWRVWDAERFTWVTLRGPQTVDTCLRYAARNPARYRVFELTAEMRAVRL